MESTAIIASSQSPSLQQMRTRSNTEDQATETKKEKLLIFGKPPVGNNLQ